MKTVFITGASGVLGQYVVDVFRGWNVLTPTHQELDLTNKESVFAFVKQYQPDQIVHLAAMTNVDYCEQHPEEALDTNAEATKYLAQASKKWKSLLTYVSTAAVFNGKKEAFSESDPPDPVNMYGKSKLQGEQYIQSILKKYRIFRPAWLIGGGKKEKKFVSYIINQSQQQDEIKVVSDKIGTISYAKDLAEVILESIYLERQSGIYHIGSQGACSRFDIARTILDHLESNVKLVPVPSSFFETTFSAPRPDREVLVSEKLPFTIPWNQSILSYLQNELV